MAIKIEADNGRVVIKADDSSHVSNISINGKMLVGRRHLPWFVGLTLVERVILKIVFGMTLCACLIVVILELSGQ